MAELLIEVFTEELPALPLLKVIPEIQENWKKILMQYSLESPFDFFYTPRRLVLIHKNFPLQQADVMMQSYGAPLSMAYNADKTPSKAMQSFLAKNNITEAEVKHTKKDGKEVLFYEKCVKGKQSKEILADMVKQWLESLNFGKSMRWANCKQSFIRPIRNICILLDSEFIVCNAYNIQANNIIVAHRQAIPKSHTQQSHTTNPTYNSYPNSTIGVTSPINSVQEYLDFLSDNGIILNQEERRQKILAQIREIEKKHDVQVESDIDLLNEIVAITEYPTALFGQFDKRFLSIPKEMIITSMKENQRYFALYKDSKLFHGFIVVSNAFHADFSLIVRGNEKVLRARLQDAEFFYLNDLKSKMSFGDLNTIIFMNGAGNLHDKVKRETKLAHNLIDLLNIVAKRTKVVDERLIIQEQEKELVLQSLQIAKNDLLSQSVGEFPELQGVMGSYFAKDLQKDSEICCAVLEQYLPHGIDSSLPSRRISAIVNLAIKADSIFTLFSLNKIPTGSKDPFALRRQASAFLRICHQFDFDISVREVCELSTVGYNSFQQEVLYSFITERIYGVFANINPSIVRCVLLRDFGIKTSFDKILALACYFDGVDIKSAIGTFKRVANILKTNKIDNTYIIDTTLFEETEQHLYESLLTYQESIKNELKRDTDSETFLARIQNLFKLEEKLNRVFDNVLIHTDDEHLRMNRTGLIALVFQEFLEFGDMREITL